MKSTGRSFCSPPDRARQRSRKAARRSCWRHGGQLPDDAGVLDEFHRHFGEGERGQSQVMLDVGGFRFIGAQKFAAGGQIEEQLADFNGSAGSAAAALDGDDFAAVDNDLGAFRARSCRARGW